MASDALVTRGLTRRFGGRTAVSSLDLRVKEGDVTGDLGFGLKFAEPGADPLLFRNMVAVVRPGGPAAAAGLVPGDEVLTVDGQAVSGANAYRFNQMTNVLPGTVVTLGLARGASVPVTAGAPP